MKIRDLRKKEKYSLDDAYLNGYARLCGIFSTGVYNSLCRHANYETQECWPEIEKIAEELSISKNSVIRGIKALEFWGIVKVSREKNPLTKRQKNNIYTLTDKSEWKPKPESRVPVVNSEPGACGEKSRVPVKECKVTNNAKDTKKYIATEVAPSIPDSSLKAEPQNPEETPTTAVAPLFDSNAYLEFVRTSDKKDYVRLIAWCGLEMGRVFPSKRAVSGFIARNSRVAQELAEYPQDQIIEAIDSIKSNEFFDKVNWGLETILKKIAK